MPNTSRATGLKALAALTRYASNQSALLGAERFGRLRQCDEADRDRKTAVLDALDHRARILVSTCGRRHPPTGIRGARIWVTRPTAHLPSDRGQPIVTSGPLQHSGGAADRASLLPHATGIRGRHGEMLARSRATIADPATVDLLTGERFGVAPPPVFDVHSSVLIHVRHDGFPYELVVVRTDRGQAWSGLEIHPPVEAVINDSDLCLIGNHAETLRIRADGAYSDVDARQVFRVASPTPPACGRGQHPFTAIVVDVFGCRQSPKFTPAELTPAEISRTAGRTFVARPLDLDPRISAFPLVASPPTCSELKLPKLSSSVSRG